MNSEKLQVLFTEIPEFKQWSDEEANGIKEFIDIDGVILGGLASFLKENYKQSLASPDMIETRAVKAVDNLTANATPELKDLILTEFYESLLEEKELFDRIVSNSSDETQHLVSQLSS